MPTPILMDEVAMMESPVCRSASRGCASARPAEWVAAARIEDLLGGRRVGIGYEWISLDRGFSRYAGGERLPEGSRIRNETALATCPGV